MLLTNFLFNHGKWEFITNEKISSKSYTLIAETLDLKKKYTILFYPAMKKDFIRNWNGNEAQLSLERYFLGHTSMRFML